MSVCSSLSPNEPPDRFLSTPPRTSEPRADNESTFYASVHRRHGLTARLGKRDAIGLTYSSSNSSVREAPSP